MKSGAWSILIIGMWLTCLATAAYSEDRNPAAAPEPSAVPAPEGAAPAPDVPARAKVPAGTVVIRDATVCQDVVDRTPVGGAAVLSRDLPRVYCFCRVTGMAGEGAIVHNWYYQGALQSSIKLPVRAANWRTWSYKVLSPGQEGEWMVEIITEDGTPLENVVFTVQ